MPESSIPAEVAYLLVIAGLFIIPRILQRWRIPSAISCVAMGGALGISMGLFHDDAVVPLLASMGIVSLFLFAGMEVDLGEIRRGFRVTVGHILTQVAMMALAAWTASKVLGLGWRPAVLFSLAILTPSTGFILDSLGGFGLSPVQASWVKTKAIATEIVALMALFVTVQSGSGRGLMMSSIALVAMVAVLPGLLQMFVRWILPHAPKSEFAFLMTLALVCAYVTRSLGVYYLVGAFVVGLTAVRLRKRIPALSSERLLASTEFFASFFIPFYFFKAGLHLQREHFSFEAIGLGLMLVVIAVPVRLSSVAIHRLFALGEPMREGARVGLSLVPTLVFTFVLADILKERYAIPESLFGALIVFALINTLLPGIILRTKPVEFTQPELPRLAEADSGSVGLEAR